MRKVIPEIGEYYHVFNRGVDKRDIFMEEYDLTRFLQSIVEFNVLDPIGSIYQNRYHKSKRLGSLTPKSPNKTIVDFGCYCLNPNHFHLLLLQKTEDSIQRFMQRLGTGYTNYFNEKYERSGSLFQGSYKAVHIETNTQLLHTSIYINLNAEASHVASGKSLSSWSEYISADIPSLCKKEIVLKQFKNPAPYESFARSSLEDIIKRKKEEKELADLLGS